MEVLHRDSLRKTGFAGVRETRLVTDTRLFKDGVSEGCWPGLGNLVYLADARFIPKGETGMHEHHEIDVVSVMVEGRIVHEGSLEHGRRLSANDVQVQRAGAEGFSHNEINPDDRENRMIQLWVLPEQAGQACAYHYYQPVKGGLTRVYGGDPGTEATLAAGTFIELAMLDAGQSMDIDVAFLAYLTRGKGFANEDPIAEGDLIRGEQLTFDAIEDTQLIIVHLQQ